MEIPVFWVQVRNADGDTFGVHVQTHNFYEADLPQAAAIANNSPEHGKYGPWIATGKVRQVR